jgi:hypothetical protein
MMGDLIRCKSFRDEEEIYKIDFKRGCIPNQILEIHGGVEGRSGSTQSKKGSEV